MIDTNKVYTPHSSCGVKSHVMWSFLCDFIDRLEGLSLNTFGHWHPSLVSTSCTISILPIIVMVCFWASCCLVLVFMIHAICPTAPRCFQSCMSSSPCHDLHLLILFQTLERGHVGTLLSGEYGVVNESRLNAKGLARESWSQLEKIGVMYDQNSDPSDWKNDV